MFHRGKKNGLASAWLSTLLTVSGAAAATGDSPLVDAARNHDLKAIRALVSQHVDVNTRAGDGSTALLWAAHQNDIDTADLLIAAGADANAANDFRMTPLSQACTNGSDAFVRLLLKSGANPNTAVATGETPLMTCAKSGSVDAVKRLVEYGAADRGEGAGTASVGAHVGRGRASSMDVVQALIDAHADLKAHSKEGFTAMHFAAREGDLEMVKVLLAAGVDVNILTEAEKGAATDARRGAAAPAPAGRAGAGGSAPAPAFQIGGRKTAGVSGYTPLARGHGEGAVSRWRSGCWITGPTPTSKRCRLYTAALGDDGTGRVSRPTACTV